jgi:hypothetical protein
MYVRRRPACEATMQQQNEKLLQVQSAPRQQRPRSSPRVAVNRRAVISMPRTGRPFPVLLVDVSAGGACVQGDIQLAVGDDVMLRAEFGPDVRFAVRAVVLGARTRRQTLYGQFGLRFIDVDAASALALKSFIGVEKKTG